MNNLRTRKTPLVVMLLLLSFVLFTSVVNAEESNRNEIRADLAEGGWQVVYGDLINEHDYYKFVKAIEEAFAEEDPGPILYFFDEQLEAQVEKIARTAPDIGEAAIRDLIVKSFNSGGSVLRQGNLEISADIATYKRWERVIYDEPRTKTCWTGGVIKTKYPCVTMERVEKTVPLPNNFQPYIRFRWVSGSGSGGASTGAATGNDRQIYFRNNCHVPIRLALRYRQPDDTWITKGWWTFDGNEHSYLASGGTRILTNNDWFYYYAESTDGSNLVWKGDFQKPFGSGSLAMRERQIALDSDGDYTLRISCD